MNSIFETDRPIYIQLVDYFKLQIISRQIKEGEKLPSVRELALQYQVNPNTIQKALAELERMKLIYTERTNGKYVTEDSKLIEIYRSDLANEKCVNFINDMKQLGFTKEEIRKYLKEKER